MLYVSVFDVKSLSGNVCNGTYNLTYGVEETFDCTAVNNTCHMSFSYEQAYPNMTMMVCSHVDYLVINKLILIM